jgi:hypothetical protein
MTISEIDRAAAAGTYTPPEPAPVTARERELLRAVAEELRFELPDWLKAELDELKGR